MIITLLRGIILYLFIIISMRFMGKRQLGELQPTELVITILISEIVSIPMQDNDIPLLNSILAVCLFACLEIINSVIIMKNTKLRYIMQGKPAVIIRDGILDQKKIKTIRFSADDVLDQLRQKDIFDINEVAFAVVETNGKLSVMKKSECDIPNASQCGIKTQSADMPYLVINDGRIIDTEITDAGLNKNLIDKVLKKEKTSSKDILLMLLYKSGKYTIIRKDKT